MRSNTIRMFTVLLISLLLLFNSCTIIGFGIGAIVDSQRPDPENKIFNREDYETIKRNKEIIVHLKDNSSKVGRFSEITEKYLILSARVGRPRDPLKIEIINLDEIRWIEIKAGGKQGKWFGLGSGLLIDFGIFFYISIMYSDFD